MDIVDKLELVRKEQDLNGSEFAKTVNLTGSAYSQVKKQDAAPVQALYPGSLQAV